MTQIETQLKIGEKVHFMLEDKHEILGEVTYIGLYYKQVDPTNDKVNAKFGYSDKILKKMQENGTIKSASYVGQHAYLDGEIYKVIDNAIEVQFDKPLYYNGIEMENWTFRELYIHRNKITT